MKDSEVSETLGKSFPKAYGDFQIEKVTVKVFRKDQGTNHKTDKPERYVYAEVSLPRVKWLEREYDLG